jgi:hypothetical protein
MNDALLDLLKGNRLLSSLPDTELEFLWPHFEHRSVEIGTILASPVDLVNFSPFPINGMRQRR